MAGASRRRWPARCCAGCSRPTRLPARCRRCRWRWTRRRWLVATKWRLPEIDLPMVIAALALVAIGLSIVFSATTVPGQHEGLWVRQLVWFGFAVGAAWLAAAIHYRAYDSFAYLLYGISI